VQFSVNYFVPLAVIRQRFKVGRSPSQRRRHLLPLSYCFIEAIL
jgi:hypothetical protein